MRFLSVLLCGSLFLLGNCQKEDNSAANVRYEVTYTALRASVGTTSFEEIRYYDGSKDIVLTNTTNNFTVTVALKPGAPVRFSAKGSVSGAATVPTVLLSYLVEEVRDDKTRVALCQQAGSSISGNTARYTFSGAFSQTFDGKTCQ